MSQDSGEIAATYFRSWLAKDFTTLRSLLADDVTFRGPLGTADDAETCIRGLQGMRQMITDIVIHKMFVDGPDALTWFDVCTSVAPPAATANWSHVEDGKINRIRVTFDPREIVAGSA
ncbi:MAG: nuclear transport factor 2 family protein [Pseudonocardiales bacterium]|nr:MAG: nuclear transport factor 2 family protein [Pseudonocardiales bacterium]